MFFSFSSARAEAAYLTQVRCEGSMNAIHFVLYYLYFFFKLKQMSIFILNQKYEAFESVNFSNIGNNLALNLIQCFTF